MKSLISLVNFIQNKFCRELFDLCFVDFFFLIVLCMLCFASLRNSSGFSTPTNLTCFFKKHLLSPELLYLALKERQVLLKKVFPDGCKSYTAEKAAGERA